jgi:hypothetical protein
MSKIIFALLFLCFCNTLQAQVLELKTIDDARALSKKGTDLFLEKKLSEFFKEVKKYWPLPANEVDGLEEKTIQYMNLLESRFGAMSTAVKVNEEKISDFALKETYLIKFEYSAIRLIYTYYKNDKGWIIHAFKWDDSFAEEFK